MLLRCMLKFKRLACGSDDVTQYNTIQYNVKSNQTIECCFCDITQTKLRNILQV